MTVEPIEVGQGLVTQLHLDYPILSDSDHRLGQALGDFRVPGMMDMGPVDNHAIFIVDAQGTIAWKDQEPDTMHVSDEDVLAALARIK